MKEEDKSLFYYFGLLGQIGLTFIFCVIFFVLIYKYILIKLFGENGFIFIIMLILGIISGFISVWKLIMRC